MNRALLLAISCGTAVGFVACSSGDAPDDAGVMSANDASASAPDATTAAMDAAAPTDSGIQPDAGVNIECDPVDGSGCSGSLACIYIGDPIGVQCRTVASPPVTHEGECSRQLHNCEAGYGCFQFMGDNNPMCRKICQLGTNDDCAGLTGSSDMYRCGARIDQGRNLGVCDPILPECLPYDDMCDSGMYCELTAGQLRCLPEGSAGPGDACPINRCRRGAICVTLPGASAQCYVPCNPDAPGTQCSGGQTCNPVTSGGRQQPFGVCN